MRLASAVGYSARPLWVETGICAAVCTRSKRRDEANQRTSAWRESQANNTSLNSAGAEVATL